MNSNETSKLLLVTRLLLALVIMFGTSWSYSYLIKPIISSKIPEFLSLIIGSMLIPYAIGFPLFLIIIWKMPKSERLSNSSVSASQFIKYAVVQSGLSVLAVTVINVAIVAVTKKAMVSTLDIQSNWFFYIVLLLIFNPVMEEIVFRKFVLERLYIYGDKFAVLASAMLFAFPHVISQGIPQLFYTFILGLVWGHITIKTNRLGYAIVLHSLSNLIGAIIPTLLAKPIAGHTIGPVIYTLIFSLIVPVAAIIIVIRNRKRINLANIE